MWSAPRVRSVPGTLLGQVAQKQCGERRGCWGGLSDVKRGKGDGAGKKANPDVWAGDWAHSGLTGASGACISPLSAPPNFVSQPDSRGADPLERYNLPGKIPAIRQKAALQRRGSSELSAANTHVMST